MTFETFVVSRETVSNPLLPSLIKAGKTVAERGCTDGVVSARYGNRIVMSTGPLAHLAVEDFVELADFDPGRNVAMVIGVEHPPVSVPLHWLLYHRDDVGGVVQLHRSLEDAPRADCTPDGAVDDVMEALRLLKNNNVINLGGDDCIAVGSDVEAAVEEIPCV